MAISTFSELQTAIANWDHRGGDTTYTNRVTEFIALCEAELQARCKLLGFETTATVTITSGVGNLPSGFIAMRSLYWDGDPKRNMEYISPDQFDAMRENTGVGIFYTISGTTIRTSPSDSGSVVATYSARFTPLSVSNTTNSLLTNSPDAYLYGSLYQAALFRQDDAAAQKYKALFDIAVARVNEDNEDRKYAGSTLVVRAR